MTNTASERPKKKRNSCRSVNMKPKQRSRAVSDRPVGRPRIRETVPATARDGMTDVHAMATAFWNDDYKQILRSHVNSLVTDGRDHDLLSQLRELLSELNLRGRYARDSVTVNDVSYLELVNLQQLEVLSQAKRVRDMTYLDPYQGMRAMSALYRHMDTELWTREVKGRRIYDARFAERLCIAMRETRPNYNGWLSTDAVLWTVDQKKYNVKGLLERVDIDGKRVVAQSMTNMNGFDVAIDKDQFPVNVERLNAQGVFAVQPNMMLPMYTWEHMLRTLKTLWTEFFDRMHAHVTKVGQGGHGLEEALYNMLARPGLEEYPDGTAPPAGGDYHTILPVIPSCDTNSYKDTTRIVNAYFRARPDAALWFLMSDDGLIRNVISGKRKRVAEWERVIPFNGNFHGIGTDNGGSHSLTYKSITANSAHVLNRRAIVARPKKLEDGEPAPCQLLIFEISDFQPTSRLISPHNPTQYHLPHIFLVEQVCTCTTGISPSWSATRKLARFMNCLDMI